MAKKIKKKFWKILLTVGFKAIIFLEAKRRNGSNQIFVVQNQDDYILIKKWTPLVTLVPGAGVDTQLYTPKEEHPHDIRVVFLGRLLKEKGVREFMQASRLLRRLQCFMNLHRPQSISKMDPSLHSVSQNTTAPHTRPISFHIYGDIDKGNPSFIDLHDIQEWQCQPRCFYHGNTKNVAQVYKKCHIVTLPSYREGLPKSLLEAASCGKAIITTDVPGCRDVVEHEKNGLLIPLGNAKSLAKAILHLAQNPGLRKEMGRYGRERALSLFSQEKIQNSFLKIQDSFLQSASLES